MARNAHIHAAHGYNGSVTVAAVRRGFQSSIKAAKQHAARTGESLADLLDRMDAADPRTATATNPVLSGDDAALGLDRVRAGLHLNPYSGLLCTHDEPDRPSPLIA